MVNFTESMCATTVLKFHLHFQNRRTTSQEHIHVRLAMEYLLIYSNTITIILVVLPPKENLLKKGRKVLVKQLDHTEDMIGFHPYIIIKLTHHTQKVLDLFSFFLYTTTNNKLLGDIHTTLARYKPLIFSELRNKLAATSFIRLKYHLNFGVIFFKDEDTDRRFVNEKKN